jgi:hypothetical protein
MKARGFITVIGTALAGASIGLAAPVHAAPAGPDTTEETSSEQDVQGGVIVIDRLGGVPLNRTRMSGVAPGLEPLQLAGEMVYLEVG